MGNLRIENHTMLRDAMQNLSPSIIRDDESNIEYGRGILVGLVAAFQATGTRFDIALWDCFQDRPQDGVHIGCLPPSWRDLWYSFIKEPPRATKPSA